MLTPELSRGNLPLAIQADNSSHSEVLDSLYQEKVKPAKIGAYHAIWVTPKSSAKNPLIFLARVVESFVVTLGLAVYGTGICAAWAFPMLSGAVLGTVKSPVVLLVGLIRGKPLQTLKSSFASSCFLGGLVGGALAYSLCSLGNGLVRIATGGKPVNKLYQANSPFKLAIFSLTFPRKSNTEWYDYSFSDTRMSLFGKLIKPIKTLNPVPYQEWGARVSADLASKKADLFKKFEQGSITKVDEILMHLRTNEPNSRYNRQNEEKTKFLKNEILELVEISNIRSNLKLIENRYLFSAFNLPHIFRPHSKEDVEYIELLVENVKKEYQKQLADLKLAEEQLLQLDKLCKALVEKIDVRIDNFDRGEKNEGIVVQGDRFEQLVAKQKGHEHKVASFSVGTNNCKYLSTPQQGGLFMHYYSDYTGVALEEEAPVNAKICMFTSSEKEKGIFYPFVFVDLEDLTPQEIDYFKEKLQLGVEIYDLRTKVDGYYKHQLKVCDAELLKQLQNVQRG